MPSERNQPFVLKVGERRIFTVQEADVSAETRERSRTHKHPIEAWSTCCRTYGGVIYLAGNNCSLDGGRTVVPHNNPGLRALSLWDNNLRPEVVFYSRPGLFFALGGRVVRDGPDAYHAKTWRSYDNLKTVEEGVARIHLPGVPPTAKATDHAWYDDVAIVRDVVALPDGTLLTTGYAPVEDASAVPFTTSGKRETAHLLKTFVLASKDDGMTWDYLSTIAATRAGDPVIEGFNEPTIALLDNGDLFCIMRTGHHTPLYSARSKDGGKTWSEPVYTGLERGCFPCLRKLADGRLLLSFGNRFPPGWSRIGAEDDHTRFVWPAQGVVKLAISADGTGESWQETTLGSQLGSCYSTMFEVAPNLVFMQVDRWYWRVMLAPRIPEDL